MAVLLETSIGDIVIDLYLDQAPKACLNFLKLCKMKYYNNCLFFSVQKDFIAQTGDPTNTGKGGCCVHAKLPGLGHRFFKDEIHPGLKHSVKGTVAMANSKPNENGSQFYITLRSKVEQLDGKHTIFGKVAEGYEVLDKINSSMVDETNAPFQNIRIRHTEILDDPLDDPEGLAELIPAKSPEPIQDEVLKTIENAEDEAELQERMASTLAKSQATTLELLHDLPDADIAPPDTDLFIAKLNPVTQDGDLELIFSRFGPIKSCEIVRDWKTGDSLQYAFVIYENAKDCEEAYFKMHDCVIDDRRIFVNFSQSVAKLWNKWRTGTRMSKDDVKGGAETKGKGRGKGRGKGKGNDAPPIMAATELKRNGDKSGAKEHSFVRDSRSERDRGVPTRHRSRSRSRDHRHRESQRDRDREREKDRQRDRRR
eukprot:TRINITY_DN31865_c0_g1_i1.p1 TRINITY_DN31865_c0_g1~~TRINITY_DN31865_c0_g1_i1.p1  ORF type:complete len:433 (-),score=67.17 TRINITY_DN31865_c0_g1_i1:85-1359(-)